MQSCYVLSEPHSPVYGGMAPGKLAPAPMSIAFIGVALCRHD